MYVQYVGIDYVLRLCLRVNICVRAVQAQQLNSGRSLCKRASEGRGRERRVLASSRRMLIVIEPDGRGK